MTGAPAVVVDGLTKSFRIPEEQMHTLKERALHPLRRSGERRFDALRSASFEVSQGEFVGIVGRNGSGKSTLLKCLAGIYRADAGGAWVTGRLSAFIELGVGFNMDLPAPDNIRLNAVMLGLTRAEARRREDEVIEFAGLEEFRNLKIKNYSSGMLVRLGFSIMVHVDADVLLIDEVLAVGDAAFQQKCYDEFARMRAEGRTLLLVTHDMGAVERFCDRAVLLERGQVAAVGEPRHVAEQYLRANFAGRIAMSASRGRVAATQPDRRSDGGATIVDAWFEQPPAYVPSSTVSQGATTRFVVRVRFDQEVEHPVFGVVIGDEQTDTILSLSSAEGREFSGHFRPGDELLWWVDFDNPLRAGQYVATPSVARHGEQERWLDKRDGLVTVLVTEHAASPGLIHPRNDFAWVFERRGAGHEQEIAT